MSRQQLSRRSFLTRSVVVLGGLSGAQALLAACSSPAAAPAPTSAPAGANAPAPAATTAPAAATGTSDINFRLGWLATAQNAGEYVALDKGYFKDEGLNVSIQPGGPNVDSVSLTAAGSADVGQVSSNPSMILARAQGVPIKAFTVVLQKHPFAWFSLKESNINKATDFAGKKIGIQATAKPLLEALEAKNNIDPSQVTVVTIGSDMLPVVNHQVDAGSGWVIDVSQLSALPQGGYNTLLLWDTGIQLYANPYFATEKTLSEKSKQLAGFVRAAARGWTDALANQEAGVASVQKYAPSIVPADELLTLKAIPPFMFTDLTKQNGWGWMDQQVWQNDIDTYFNLKQINKSFPATDIITMDILNAAPERPKQ
jgi:NitT/TauT family transport system substrate-binding protein